jgi:hypothetical protein
MSSENSTSLDAVLNVNLSLEVDSGLYGRILKLFTEDGTLLQLTILHKLREIIDSEVAKRQHAEDVISQIRKLLVNG